MLTAAVRSSGQRAGMRGCSRGKQMLVLALVEKMLALVGREHTHQRYAVPRVHPTRCGLVVLYVTSTQMRCLGQQLTHCGACVLFRTCMCKLRVVLLDCWLSLELQNSSLSVSRPARNTSVHVHRHLPNLTVSEPIPAQLPTGGSAQQLRARPATSQRQPVNRFISDALP